MTDSRWRILEVLEVKKRALEEMTSLRWRALEKVSSASLLARLKQEGLIATKWNDPAAASPHKKSATTRGGRKRLATENQRFYLIGGLVDQMFSRLESAFRISKEFKLANGNWDVNTLRSELARHKFTPKEIDAVLQARTPMSATKRFVAKSLTSRAHPNGISLQTVNSCYSRYVKALESKRTLL
jgi:DNA-binding PadR family transcriptional regulator